ncbi:MAG: hypothetical protein AUJ57_08140 [Zetaproteobacteria bacterium CG1_02_53_45]|nr:MAG: hypothetical protein AUJ57_08140 [Zetaproteobacteria bacterium CG1_02_53_45]
MQKFKRQLGLCLFWASWLLWGVLPALPFVLDADGATTAMVATGLLVAAEVSFFGSLLLLGKPFYQLFKARLKPYWLTVTGRWREKH